MKWIHSYISGRSSYAKVGQSCSAVVFNSSGVPQGSVLGPILFSVYIAPIGRMVDASNDVSYHTYADDTQIYVRRKDAGCMTALVACMSHLQHWFLRNMLLLNGSESDAIIFGTAQRHTRSKAPSFISVAGCDIVTKDNVKLLGVTYDRTLSFDAHVQLTVRARNFHLAALRHIRPVMSDDVAKTVGCSIVGSKLDVSKKHCQITAHTE